MRYPTNDLEHFFMPFTANKAFKANPRLMVASKGVECTTHEGRTILDMSSGLFCAPAGHSRAEIADAVSEMLRECAYVAPFQHGQPAAFELARRLKAIMPGDGAACRKRSGNSASLRLRFRSSRLLDTCADFA